MLLVSADFTLTSSLSKQANTTFYVVCKIKSAEWRSKPSDREGLQPTWTHQQLQLEYKEVFNIMTIEVRDREKPEGKPACIGS